MLASLCTNLTSLAKLIGFQDFAASLRARSWPEPVGRAARAARECLAGRLPVFAEILAPARPEPAPARRRRAPRARPAAGKSVATLIAALRSSVPEAADAAAAALGAHRSERARQALAAALRNRDGYTSPSTRIAALHALARSLAAGDEEPLCEAARDVDPDVSLAAIEALTARGSAAARAALEEIAEDTTIFFLPAARRAARQGLATLRERT